MDWYALFVQTGNEEYVQKWLRFNFNELTLHSLVPKRKIAERKQGKVHHVLKILFPGYVLIQTEMDDSLYKRIVSIPKCIRILNNGTYYSKISDEEIYPILRLTSDSGILDYSKVYMENSAIIVKSGPLQGLEGIIRKIDTRKNKAKILINFMNSERMVDVGIEVLEISSQSTVS